MRFSGERLTGMDKSPEAFRTISEVAEELELPQHVLRFWETRFTQVKPMKRGGGRRYYRPEDLDVLRRIKSLLYDDGYTIKGAQKLLKDGGEVAADEPPAERVATKPTKSEPFSDPVSQDALRELLTELEDTKKLL